MQKFEKVKQSDGFFSVDPLPDKSELADFYRQIYYQDLASATYQSTYTQKELAHKNLRAELLLFAVSKCGAKKGRFLEVGCGEGFVLNAAAQDGFQVKGVDFSNHAVLQFNPCIAGDVVTGDAFDELDKIISAETTFDVCVLQNVLEHVIDPEGLLERLKAVLADDGRLIITVPNDYSELQGLALNDEKVSSEYWFAPPQHLHYFNVDSLNRFVERKGYRVLDSFADFPIEMYLFHPGSNYVKDRALGKHAHLARIELDLLMARNGLGPYHRYCQALTDCGAGRNVTVILQKA